jgi:uncharacterized protein YukE
MTITMHSLYTADPARLHAFADRWDRLAADIDASVEDLVAGTRDLPVVWSGEAGAAAQERARRLEVKIGNASGYCSHIKDTTRAFAEKIADCQLRLKAEVANARSNYLVVDLEAGTISAPPPQPDDGRPDITLAGIVSIDDYVTRITQILDAAAAAERVVHDLFSDYQGRHADEYLGHSLKPVTPDDLYLVTDTYDDLSRAHWWYGLHQLNRDDVIAQHPELIGSLEGLPGDARDQANRLLLSREKEELLLRQERLDETQDGAGSRATADVDRRLAEIAETERKLAAEPGAHLLSTNPPVIGRTDPRWDDFPD